MSDGRQMHIAILEELSQNVRSPMSVVNMALLSIFGTLVGAAATLVVADTKCWLIPGLGLV